MFKTVYIFGAGINNDLRSPDGLRPPLATDFFQLALQHPRNSREYEHISGLDELLGYIRSYWKLSREDLETQAFNLEQIYTVLEAQIADAIAKHDPRVVFLAQYQTTLTRLFTQYLSEFDKTAKYGTAEEHSSWTNYRRLAAKIQHWSSDIITFNYDTILENALDSTSTSGERGASSDLNEAAWQRIWRYGVEFDEIVCVERSPQPFVPSPIARPKTLILKLHGSINWAETQHTKFLSADGDQDAHTRVYLEPPWTTPQPLEPHQRLRPLIIAPVVSKNIHSRKVFAQAWHKAKQVLQEADRLIVGGYSFPPSDFEVRRLFLESFERASPKEVVIINPDTSVAQIVKDLAHFAKPVVVCKSIVEFLEWDGVAVHD